MVELADIRFPSDGAQWILPDSWSQHYGLMTSRHASVGCRRTCTKDDDAIFLIWTKLTMHKPTRSNNGPASSSPRAFHIIWGRRNSIVYYSSPFSVSILYTSLGKCLHISQCISSTGWTSHELETQPWGYRVCADQYVSCETITCC